MEVIDDDGNNAEWISRLYRSGTLRGGLTQEPLILPLDYDNIRDVRKLWWDPADL